MKNYNLLKAAEKIYGAYLKKNSKFFTRERRLILESIFRRPGHFSADELIFEIHKSSKKVSRATVYRCLNQMVKSGILVEVDFGHGHTHYELALGNKKHMHLICIKTGNVQEVLIEELDKILQSVCKEYQFDLQYHKIQLFGISKLGRDS
jgi:Fur family ferric uptake transcriptional regulator